MKPGRLIHQDAGPDDLAILRIWVYGLWGIKLALDPMHRLASLPRSIYRPVGLLHWLPSGVWRAMLTPAGLWSVKIALLLALAAATLGVATRAATAGSFVLLVAYKTLLQGFGDIPHVELVHLFAAGIVALFPCADALALRPGTPRPDRPELYSVPLIAVVGLLCLTYTFVGAYRLLHGLGAMTSARSMEFWTLELTLGSTNERWELGLAFLDRPWAGWLLAFGFPVTNAFELLAPLCLVSRRFRRLFVAWMIPFHLGAWLLMKIFFWENLVLYLFLADSPSGGEVPPASGGRRGP